MIASNFLEQLQTWANEKISSKDIEKAKENYFSEFGKVFPDDYFFDQRMYLFDCYRLFEHSFEALEEMTVYEAWRLHQAIEEKSSPAHGMYKEVLGFRHSVYKVCRSSSDNLELIDLWSEESLGVKSFENQKFIGINARDVLQGFVVFEKSKTYIAPGLIHHPRASSSIIVKRLLNTASKTNLAKESILKKLALLNLKHLRQKNLLANLIYQPVLAMLENPT